MRMGNKSGASSRPTAVMVVTVSLSEGSCNPKPGRSLWPRIKNTAAMTMV
jgi:hypothetical protein